MILACLKNHSSHRLARSLAGNSLLVASLLLSSTTLGTEPLEPPADRRTISALVDHINSLRSDLEIQQSALGAYDTSLLPVLNQLGEALVSAGALQEAQNAIEQQLQIVRINDGLYASAQIALINQQLAILAAQGNWPAMQDRLQYLTWVFDRTDQLSVSERVEGLKTARDWARLLLTRGPRDQEPMYLLQLRSLEESAVNLATSSALDPDSLRTYIYDHALAELYIALGIIGTTDTSYFLINRTEGTQTTPLRPGQRISSVSDVEAVYGARTSSVIERSHRTAMSKHYQLLSSLTDTFVDELNPDLALDEQDPEAAAMIQLYLGDSVLLRTQYELRLGTNTGPTRGSASTGIAARYYQRAWDLLLRAGYGPETLNEVFACPVLLPLTHFSARLDTEQAGCTIDEEGAITMPTAFAVRHGVPGLDHTELPDYAVMPPIEGISTTLNFNVGVNGQADRVQIMASEPETMTARIRGRDSLLSRQFRPSLSDGRATRSADVTMTIYTLGTN